LGTRPTPSSGESTAQLPIVGEVAVRTDNIPRVVTDLQAKRSFPCVGHTVLRRRVPYG
jgi:hypothetical protein